MKISRINDQVERRGEAVRSTAVLGVVVMPRLNDWWLLLKYTAMSFDFWSFFLTVIAGKFWQKKQEPNIKHENSNAP